MEELKAEVKGIETNYTVEGLGTPLLILHGWGSSSESWERVQSELAHDGFSVICLDLPGFGKTFPPPEAWGVSLYAAFVLSFLAQLGLNRVVLLGHSFGGQIAVRIASEHPDLAEKLILVAPAALRHDPGVATKAAAVAAKTAGALFYLFPASKLKQNMKSLLYMLLRRRDYLQAEGVMRQVFQRVIREDSTSFLSRISAPTLLIWGDRDSFVPLEDAFELERSIPHATLKVIPNVGHSPQLAVPEETISLIREFLG
ncbi:MAG: alpha/beta hydrolase [Candidatus Pacearchaeota archaeon]|nr:alpha/beta hydrolase [Candidatus Pacearchaeota archaeon]